MTLLETVKMCQLLRAIALAGVRESIDCMAGWSNLMQPTNATNVHMGRARTLVMAFEGGFEGESIKLTDQCVGPQARYCISSLHVPAYNYKILLLLWILSITH